MFLYQQEPSKDNQQRSYKISGMNIKTIQTANVSNSKELKSYFASWLILIASALCVHQANSQCCIKWA